MCHAHLCSYVCILKIEADLYPFKKSLNRQIRWPFKSEIELHELQSTFNPWQLASGIELHELHSSSGPWQLYPEALNYMSSNQGSVVDPERFDADPDPDPTFQADADPDPNPFTRVRNFSSSNL